MKINPNKEQLATLLEAFIRGDDRSASFASKIEGFVIEHFYEDDELQNLLTALASYCPGGGEFLYDETALCKVMKESLCALRVQ